MFQRIIATVLVALAAMSSAVAQTDASSAQEFLGSKYGFTLTEPKDLTCNGGMITIRPGTTWYTLCESGLNTAEYVGVMTKNRFSEIPAIHKDFGNVLLEVTKDQSQRSLKCISDKTPVIAGGMHGAFVDCILMPASESQKPVHFTTFYFSPKGSDILGKVIIFSDFGKGEKDHDTFKAAARASVNANLKKVTQ
ncbi:MAG: hypothetical protein KBC50_03625 [Candidatus Pacebacteria bacterium]|nr:hypothetical protein [Candidatus Paceibacterota bacterium]